MATIRLIRVSGSLAILFFLNTWIISTSGGEEKNQKLYTAFNIWYEKPHNLRFINYKIWNILPAGTEISNFELSEGYSEDIILFKAQGQTFSLKFNRSFYPSKTLKSISEITFTSKNFQELTAGMSEKETDGVKRGTPVVGMTKKEVIIAFGYPPEHRTKSLKLNRWKYWKSRHVYFYICFDEREFARHCYKPDDIWRG